MKPSAPGVQTMFLEPDALLNWNVPQLIQDYKSQGGDPRQAVKDLCSSFHGSNGVVHVFCDVLEFVKPPVLFRIHILRSMGVPLKEIDETISDSLMKFLRRRFDCGILDARLFERFPHSPPEWLGSLCENGRWRRFVYELSEDPAHRDSFFVRMLVQLISRAGRYSAEISRLTSVSSSFTLFSDVWLSVLEELMTLDCSNSEFSLSRTMANFKKICCFSQFTYIYAQLIVQKFARESAGDAATTSRLRRIQEELEEAAVATRGGKDGRQVRRIPFLFLEHDCLSRTEVFRVGASGYRENVFSGASGAMLSMMGKGMTNPADMLKLHRLFDGDQRPSVDFLRHRLFLKVLVRDLFNPNRTIQLLHRTRYIFVLTFATAPRNVSPGSSEFEVLRKTITQAVSFCSSKTASLDFRNTLGKLRRWIGFTPISLGILQWLRCVYFDKTYHLSAYTVQNSRASLSMVQEIALRHENLREAVLKFIIELLSFDSVDDEIPVLVVLDVRKIFLDACLYLVRLGLVLPTLRSLVPLFKKMDVALTQHFLVGMTGLVDMARPAFSVKFVSVFAEILALKRIHGTRLRGHPLVRAVAAFGVQMGDRLNPRLLEVCARYQDESSQ